MKRTFIESLVTEKSLRIINGHAPASRNDSLIDAAFEANPDAPEIKNVCAKVTSHLSNEIDTLCAFLGISKRSFIESALIDAVEKANQIIDEEGVHDVLGERISVQPTEGEAQQ